MAKSQQQPTTKPPNAPISNSSEEAIQRPYSKSASKQHYFHMKAQFHKLCANVKLKITGESHESAPFSQQLQSKQRSVQSELKTEFGRSEASARVAQMLYFNMQLHS